MRAILRGSLNFVFSRRRHDSLLFILVLCFLSLILTASESDHQKAQRDQLAEALGRTRSALEEQEDPAMIGRLGIQVQPSRTVNDTDISSDRRPFPIHRRVWPRSSLNLDTNPMGGEQTGTQAQGRALGAKLKMGDREVCHDGHALKGNNAATTRLLERGRLDRILPRPRCSPRATGRLAIAIPVRSPNYVFPLQLLLCTLFRTLVAFNATAGPFRPDSVDFLILTARGDFDFNVPEQRKLNSSDSDSGSSPTSSGTGSTPTDFTTANTRALLDLAALPSVRLLQLEPLSFPNARNPRFGLNFFKLRAWELEEYDVVALMDADMAVVGTGLWELLGGMVRSPMMASGGSGSTSAHGGSAGGGIGGTKPSEAGTGNQNHLPLQPGPLYPFEVAMALDLDKETYTFDSLGRAQGGLVLLRPCAALAEFMLALLRGCEWLQFPKDWAEQSFLDWFWKFERVALPPQFNAMSHLLDPRGRTYAGTLPSVVHFTRRKVHSAADLEKAAEGHPWIGQVACSRPREELEKLMALR